MIVDLVDFSEVLLLNSLSQFRLYKSVWCNKPGSGSWGIFFDASVRYLIVQIDTDKCKVWVGNCFASARLKTGGQPWGYREEKVVGTFPAI